MMQEKNSYPNFHLQGTTVQPGGTLFCLHARTLQDIPKALAQGAVRVFVAEQDRSNVPVSSPYIHMVPCVHDTLHYHLHNVWPLTQSLYLAGVTGTDGKTSVTYFTQALWQAIGQPSGSIGTLGLYKKGVFWKQPSALTTPDPITLHKNLYDFAQQGVQHVCIEASSHGLDQNRFGLHAFSTATWTSFGLEHLDYHKTVDQYRSAKEKIFSHTLTGQGYVSTHVPFWQELTKTYDHVTAYGEGGHYTWHYDNDMLSVFHHGQLLGDIPIILQHPVHRANFVAALLMVRDSGVPLQDIIAQAQNISLPPGRMEYIDTTPKGAKVYVDFAHTPQSLEHVLKHYKNVWLVMGVGGNRHLNDAEACQQHALKRFEMGRIASYHSDYFCLCDDNPRYEDAQKIRHEVALGCCRPLKAEGTRWDMIHYALTYARCGDSIVVAGRGHETHQRQNGEDIPFHDATVIRQILKKI